MRLSARVLVVDGISVGQSSFSDTRTDPRAPKYTRKNVRLAPGGPNAGERVLAPYTGHNDRPTRSLGGGSVFLSSSIFPPRSAGSLLWMTVPGLPRYQLCQRLSCERAWRAGLSSHDRSELVRFAYLGLSTASH